MNRAKQKFAEHLLDNMTWPEKILWSRLKRKQTGYSFQRQAIVRGYVVDFYCPAAKIAIEVDGKHHEEPERSQEDKRRDDFLSRNGVKVLRFQVFDVMKGMSAVLIRIWDECYRRAPISVTPFLKKGGLLGDRRFESVEMRGLRHFKEEKRLETRSEAFARIYREKHSNTVQNRWKPRKRS